MEFDFLILSRVIIGVISVIVLTFIVKARFVNRLGNEFFVIMIIFWVGLLTIVIQPSILDLVLNNTGFVNRSQFLLTVTIGIILYLLVNETRKNKSVIINLNKTIRSIALNFFNKEYSNEQNVDIVILIPAKNEAKSLKNVIQNIKKIKIPYSFKILVVNDGSTDETENIARNNDTLVITHYQNLGIGGAIKSGYLASRILEPKIVISIDADGQHNPSHIPEMIKKIEDGADLVYGTRFAKESSYKTSSVRLIGNKFYTNLVNKIGGIQITDVTSGFRAVRFDRLSDIFFNAESNFAIELAIRAAKKDLKITEVTTVSETRRFGRSQLYRIEKFFTYNVNVVIQIINAYYKKIRVF